MPDVNQPKEMIYKRKTCPKTAIFTIFAELSSLLGALGKNGCSLGKQENNLMFN